MKPEQDGEAGPSRQLGTFNGVFAPSILTFRGVDAEAGRAHVNNPPIQTVLWRWLDGPGHEIARLDGHGDGWALAGTAVFAHVGTPSKLDYAVVCDAAWQTTSARVAGVVGDRAIDLEIAVDPDREWRLDGVACPAVAGCTDLDLGFSPATNLLPIRRLSLAVGEDAEVVAAWLPFPSFAFERLPQVYRRESETTYRYSSAGGRFTCRLEVDATGFVTDYPELWRAEARRGA